MLFQASFAAASLFGLLAPACLAQDAYTGDGLNAPKVLGKDNHPTVDHLVQAATSLGVFNLMSSDRQYMLDNLNIVLLALTKVNADGQWITSMFNYADDKGVATVALSSGKGWDPYPVEFAKLDKLKAHMPLDDHAWEITVVDPWWPWAIADAALQMSKEDPASTEDTFKVSSIFHTLTGYEIQSSMPSDQDLEMIWTDYLSKVDSMPVLLDMSLLEDEQQRGWYIGWTVLSSNEKRVVECSRLSAMLHVGGLQKIELDLKDVRAKVKEVLYLKDFTSFAGRVI